MSDKEKIRYVVGRLRRTRRWQVVLDYFVVGLFWGAIPAALAILASRIWIYPVSEYYIAGALLAATALGFLIASAFVRLTPLAVANDIDVSLGLRERVSSALALDGGRTAKDPFVKTLVKDAAGHVDGLPLRKVYPWTLPPAWRLALPALLIAALMVFVPQLNLFASERDREEIKLVQDQGNKLMDLAKKLEEEAEKKQDPVIKQQAEEIKRVGEKLERGNLKKKEALKELQRLKEKLETQAQAQIPEGQQKLLGELGEQLAKLDATGELAEMLQSGDMQGLLSELAKLSQSLMQGQMSPQQQEMLDQLAKALGQTLDSQAAQSPDAEAMKKLLEDLKKAIEQDQQLREAMEEALNALEQDVNALTESLAQNGMPEQAEQLDQLMQQMQQQMAQSGMVSPQTMDQMRQALEQTQQSIDNNQSLSEQSQQRLTEQTQKALEHFQKKEGG